MRNYTRLYLNGEWVRPLAGEVVDVINPATESPAGKITPATVADVDRAAEAARAAFVTFSRSSRQERLDLLSNILSVYGTRSQDLADVLTEELGAPAKFAKETQVGSASCTCARRSPLSRTTASNIPKVLAARSVASRSGSSE